MVVQEFQPLGATGKSYSTPTQDNSILSTSSQSSSICFIVLPSTYDWMFLVPWCLNFMEFLKWIVSDKTLFLHVFWMVTDYKSNWLSFCGKITEPNRVHLSSPWSWNKAIEYTLKLFGTSMAFLNLNFCHSFVKTALLLLRSQKYLEFKIQWVRSLFLA
jgi:hypothetical protein